MDTDWNAIKTEYETTDATVAKLASKYCIPASTLKSRKLRHGWAKPGEVVRPQKKDAPKPRKDAKTQKTHHWQDKPKLVEVEVILPANLTPKEKLFVTHYIVDKNASKAARLAGYEEKNAGAMGHELLKKPEIRSTIDAALEAQLYSIGINKHRVLLEYARLGFFDPRKLFDADGYPIPINHLDDDTAAALAGLDVKEEYAKDEDGKMVFAGYTKKYKLAEKKGALDSIAKHLGLLVDKVEHTGKNGGPITVRFVDPRGPD